MTLGQSPMSSPSRYPGDDKGDSPQCHLRVEQVPGACSTLPRSAREGHDQVVEPAPSRRAPSGRACGSAPAAAGGLPARAAPARGAGLAAAGAVPARGSEELSLSAETGRDGRWRAGTRSGRAVAAALCCFNKKTTPSASHGATLPGASAPPGFRARGTAARLAPSGFRLEWFQPAGPVMLAPA